MKLRRTWPTRITLGEHYFTFLQSFEAGGEEITTLTNLSVFFLKEKRKKKKKNNPKPHFQGYEAAKT